MGFIELLKAVVCALVDEPEEVDVQEFVGSTSTMVEIRTAREDVGKVIGRGGRLAEALRTVFQAIGMKDKTRYIIQIIDGRDM